MFAVGLWLFAHVPLLLDPAGAAQKLEQLEPPGLRAEAALLLHEPSRGLDAVGRLPEGPRRLRLELDLKLVAGDLVGAERAAAALGEAPGWAIHSAWQGRAIDSARNRRRVRHFGLAMFAVTLAALALGGARELLKPSRETLMGAAGLFLASWLGQQGSPFGGQVLGLLGAALWALTHAAAAARRRVEPSGRGRALLMALVVVGLGGVLLAALSQVGPADLMARALGRG